MASTDKHIAKDGASRTIEYARRSDDTGSSPAMEFVEQLPREDRIRLLALFEHVAERGETNLAKGLFKRERGNIYTFKLKSQKRLVRFPCFRRGRRWIITHAFVKTTSKSKWPKQQFKLAIEIMNEIIQRETANS